MAFGKRGRPFNVTYPLGQVMRDGGWRVKDAAIKCGIEPRLMSDYLANVIAMKPTHLDSLCEMMDCDAEDILPDAPAKWLNVHKSRINPEWAAIHRPDLLTDDKEDEPVG